MPQWPGRLQWMRETVGRGKFAPTASLLDYHVGRFVADAEALYSYEGTREMNCHCRGDHGFQRFRLRINRLSLGDSSMTPQIKRVAVGNGILSVATRKARQN